MAIKSSTHLVARLVLATGGCSSDSKATDLRLEEEEATGCAGSVGASAVADPFVVVSSSSQAVSFPFEAAVERVA